MLYNIEGRVGSSVSGPWSNKTFSIRFLAGGGGPLQRVLVLKKMCVCMRDSERELAGKRTKFRL